jgi:hypothetical protein
VSEGWTGGKGHASGKRSCWQVGCRRVTGRNTADGSLVSKMIRGRRYWYTQRHEAGRKLQSYIGPETPEVLALIERWRRILGTMLCEARLAIWR